MGWLLGKHDVEYANVPDQEREHKTVMKHNRSTSSVTCIRFVRFLWLVVRFPLGIILATASMIATPILWVELTAQAPWWAYLLGFIGALLCLALAGFGALLLFAIPFILAEKLADEWRASK